MTPIWVCDGKGPAASSACSTLADWRAAIDDLRLEERSLAEAVQGHSERFTRATGIPRHLTLDLAADGALPAEVADHAARIVGESLTNITRPRRRSRYG